MWLKNKFSNTNNKKYVRKLMLIILTLVTLINIPLTILADDEDEDEQISENEKQEITVESATKPTEEPQLNCEAAVIFDRTTGQVLWGKNETKKRAMASTTKIMTSIVVLENANLTDTVTISKKAANTGGSRLKISTNDKITVNDLLYGLMMRSRK